MGATRASPANPDARFVLCGTSAASNTRQPKRKCRFPRQNSGDALCAREQAREAVRIGGLRRAMRQRFDVADRKRISVWIKEKERATIAAVVAPHLRGAVFAHKLRNAERDSNPRRIHA